MDNFNNREENPDVLTTAPKMPSYSKDGYMPMQTAHTNEQRGGRYAEIMLRKAEYENFRLKMNRVISVVVIICLVGAPLLGMGIGFGVQFANNYVLPRLLNDSAERMAFSFETAQNRPLFVAQGGDFASRPNYVDIVQHVMPSVVTITAQINRAAARSGFSFGPSLAAGTGILMHETSSRYYIATNAHVIEGASAVGISIEGSPYIAASPVGRDTDADLAVIAITKADALAAGITGVRLANFGESGYMRVGDIVLAIGNAMGEGNTATNGIVSGLDKEIFVSGRTLSVLQTNAAINHGNSGGPLVNIYGEVIGINTAKFVETMAEGMGYAIPTDVAMPILERIMQTPPTPAIGIRFDTLNEMRAIEISNRLAMYGFEHVELPDFGIVIAGIIPNSPAENAGLDVYDIITHMNGEPIRVGQELADAISAMYIGDQITLTIVRNGSETFDISLRLSHSLLF